MADKGTEFLTTAAETIKGLGPLKENRKQHHSVWRKSIKGPEEV